MAGQSPRRPRPERATLIGLGACAFALAALAAFAPSVDAIETSFDAFGPPLDVQGRIPTFMNRGTVVAEDLDGDGTDELLYMTADGVLQRYAPDGRFLWSTDYRAVDALLGIGTIESSQFFAEYEWLRPQFQTENGWTTVDTDGDGVKELVATIGTFTREPVPIAGSIVATFDGLDGTVLDARLFSGIVRHVLPADVDGDGQEELVFVEEDGAVYDVGTMSRGTGGTTRVWAEDPMTQQVLWTWSSGVSWGLVRGFGVGGFDGDGMDVALAITSSVDQHIGPDHDANGTTQEVVALDGRTGTVLWREPALPFVRQLAVGDVDGDALDDVVLRIQEARIAEESRGDEAGHVEARRGLDGTLLWSYRGLLGNQPVVHDLALTKGAVPMVAFAYTERQATDLVIEQSAHLALVEGSTGTLVQDVLVTSEVVPVEEFVLIRADTRAPKPAPTQPFSNVAFLHIAPHDTDGDGDQDLFVGSDRGVIAFETTAVGLQGVWERPDPVDVSLFKVLETGEGLGIWTQGWTRTAGIDVAEGTYNTVPTFKHGRLFGYSVFDGAPRSDVIMMAQVHGLARSDVDGDGVIDRVMGGVSGALFAMNGSTEEVHWVADVGAAILDVWTEDLDGDGRDDFLVEANVRMAAVSADGIVLWSYVPPYVQPFHGVELRETKPADLNGDGVRDLVFSMPGGQGAGIGGAPSRIVAVDGTSGQELWVHPVFVPFSNPYSIVAGDLDGDGDNDVAYTVRYPHVQYAVGAIDGADGSLLWRSEEFPSAAGHAFHENAIALVDEAADGSFDVAVATERSRIRIHDGATGDILRDIVLPSAEGTLNRIITGHIGPQGEHAVAALRFGGKDMGYRIDGYLANGSLLYTERLPGVGFLFDAEVGDVTGDGNDEIVAGNSYGLVIIDPSNASAPGVHVGHVSNHDATKVFVHDVDDDGRAEIDYVTDEGNWPILHGEYTGAIHDVGKEVATLDPNGLPDPIDPDPDPDPDPEEPVNRPPVASFIVDRQSANIGEAFTFTSTSSDPDGSVVTTTWTFGDGSTATGATVTRSFAVEGQISVHLQVTDDNGTSAHAYGHVYVAPDFRFAIDQSAQGGLASPGDVVTYTITLYNTGASRDTFQLDLTAPAAWSVQTDKPRVLALDGGTRHTWQVRVGVDEPWPHGAIEATVRNSEGATQARTFWLAVPLLVDAHLDEDPAVYGPLDEVTGQITLRWRDGSAVSNATVRLMVDGRPGPMLTTGPDGMATFALSPEGTHWSLGAHTVRLDPVLSPYTVARMLPFEVQVGG